MRRAALALGLLLLAGCHPRAPSQAAENVRITAEPVTLTAADGVKIAGVYTGVDAPKALILLFHQAESSKDEYALIAPRLASQGYASLRIDQRAGGSLFGINETVRKLGPSDDFLAAKQDLEAAYAWASARKLPLVLWGSSYSASLAIVLAAEHPGLAGVLAFSPGEYFPDPHTLTKAAARVQAPLFVTSAQDGKEIDAARAALDASPATRKIQFVPKLGGVHGSATLLRARNPQGAEAAWSSVLAFLHDIAP